MKKLFVVMVASTIVALTFIAAATAARGAGPFAVGSGKVDAFAGEQHLSFSAHNPQPPGASGLA